METFDIVVDAQCETGHSGSYTPIVGNLPPDSIPPETPPYYEYDDYGDEVILPATPAVQAKITPFREGSEWFFEAGAEKKPIENGFYRDKSVYTNRFTGATHFVVKIPRSELNQPAPGNIGLEAYCNGRRQRLEVTLPVFQKEKPLQDFTRQLSAQESPDYKAMDQDEDGDGIQRRRGLFATGPRSRKSSRLIVEHLQEQGFRCERKESEDTVKDTLDLISASGEAQLDYLVRDTHTHGYSGSIARGVLFYLVPKGTVYRCTRMEHVEWAPKLLQEVFLVGYDQEGERSLGVPLSLRAFVDALKASERQSELLFANMACSTQQHSGEILLVASGLPIRVIATQHASQRITNYAMPDRDSHLAMLSGFLRSFTYRQIRAAYPQIVNEDVLMPDHPDYSSTLRQALARAQEWNQDITLSGAVFPLPEGFQEIKAALEKDTLDLTAAAKAELEARLNRIADAKIESNFRWESVSSLSQFDSFRAPWLQWALKQDLSNTDLSTLWPALQDWRRQGVLAFRLGTRAKLYAAAALCRNDVRYAPLLTQTESGLALFLDHLATGDVLDATGTSATFLRGHPAEIRAALLACKREAIDLKSLSACLKHGDLAELTHEELQEIADRIGDLYLASREEDRYFLFSENAERLFTSQRVSFARIIQATEGRPSQNFLRTI
ncbi:hypothetical protein K2X33_01750, partial [bacterium]|nr:hypothetical protein [bacterium]